MGESCAQGVVAQARDELVRLLNDTSYNPRHFPCTVIQDRMSERGTQDSCSQLLTGLEYGFGNSMGRLLSSDFPLSIDEYK
jgi:hypothetical protein